MRVCRLRRPLLAIDTRSLHLHPDRLLAHASYHTGKTAFPCPSCSTSFSRKCRLVAHAKKVHGGVAVGVHIDDDDDDDDALDPDYGYGQ